VLSVKAVFLDRDGVINRDRDDYVKNLAELEVYAFAPSAIRRLNDHGFAVYVVSNQQGVAKGLISEADLMAIESEIDRRIREVGGRINGFEYCRHLASEGCSCRKPQPGMILGLARRHGLDVYESVMVGDSERDIAAGRAAGCATVLVGTGKLTADMADSLSVRPDVFATDLGDAVDWIISRANKD